MRERPWSYDIFSVTDRKDGAKDLFVERYEIGKITGQYATCDAAYKILTVGEIIEVPTNIDRHLIIHIPNFRINTSPYGISDYHDVESIFEAINNRYTRIRATLDKHSDPILMLPEGILDDEGKVHKAGIGVIEVMKGDAPAQYLIWDAKMESAFQEIDKLVDSLYMVKDISPVIFGKETGTGSDSGIALKRKLMRTLAQKHRKELYYVKGIQEIIYTAQIFCKANKLRVGSVQIIKDAVLPEVVTQDGVINDLAESLDNEIKSIDARLTTRKDAIARAYNLSAAEAEAKIEEIKKEKEGNVLDVPLFSTKPKTVDPTKEQPPFTK